MYEALLKRHHPELWEHNYGETAKERKKNEAKNRSKNPDSADKPPPYDFTPPGQRSFRDSSHPALVLACTQHLLANTARTIP